jgi:hypothetical protein
VCGVACSVLSATSRPARAAQPVAPLGKHTYTYMWSFLAQNGTRGPSLEAHGAQPRTTQWIGRSTRDSQHPIETRNVERKMGKYTQPMRNPHRHRHRGGREAVRQAVAASACVTMGGRPLTHCPGHSTACRGPPGRQRALTSSTGEITSPCRSRSASDNAGQQHERTGALLMLARRLQSSTALAR